MKNGRTATARTAQLPFDHLVAEVAVAPLTSATALRNAIVALQADMSRETTALWRATERAMVRAFPGVSLDELIHIRDDAWFGNRSAGPVSMTDYLRALAAESLELRDGEFVPRGRQATPSAHVGQARARQFWRWLSLAVPTDLLLAAYRGGSGARLAQVGPLVDRELSDNGFAETHLHLGASLDFTQLWSALVIRMSCRSAIDDFSAPGADFDEGRDLLAWVARAVVARFVVAAYVTQPSGSFLDFLRGRVTTDVTRAGGATSMAVLWSVLGDLADGALSQGVDVSAILGLYRTLVGVQAVPRIERLEDLRAYDPILPFVSADDSIERGFARDCMQLIDARSDRELATVFWQYERIRCALFRHVTQRPLTPGLPWFVRFYSRMARVRGGFISVSALLDAASARPGLRALEVRTTPEPNESAWLTELQQYDEWARRPPVGGRDIELGLIAHFSKSRGDDARTGRPWAYGRNSNADPEAGRNSGMRFGHFARGWLTEANTTASVIRRYPLSLLTLRALDVCSDETAVPAWVLAPSFRIVRRSAAEAIAYLHTEHSSLPSFPQPLRATAHAGEDFVHLMTGLRQVDEAVTYLDLGEGDRLGHAVALGIDPGAWAQRAGQIPVRVEDRVFDLAWELQWYGLYGLDPPAGRVTFVQRELARLAAQWFDRAVGPQEIEWLFVDLGNEDELDWAGFPDRVRPADPGTRAHRRSLLLRYLTDPEVYRRGCVIGWVDAGAEASAIETLQSALRTRIGRLGLTIEMNPTSNLLIGDLSDLDHHPLWRLRSPRTHEGGVPGERLAVCVGSDDPTVFCTDLANEYQLLHDALVLAGEGEADATLWLRDVRSEGMNSRFTYPRDRTIRFDCIVRAV